MSNSIPSPKRDYSWIKVKHFKFDSTKSWEENYKALETHHIEETKFLIDTINVLKKQNVTGKSALIDEDGQITNAQE
jgi:hypothetical protein